jgi:hypothetical protein
MSPLAKAYLLRMYKGLYNPQPNYKYPAPALTNAIMGNSAFMRSQGFGPTSQTNPQSYAEGQRNLGNFLREHPEWLNQALGRGAKYEPLGTGPTRTQSRHVGQAQPV